MRQELAEGNEQLKHFKAMEQEENRIIDLRCVLSELLKLFGNYPLSLSFLKKKDGFYYYLTFQDTKLSTNERRERGQKDGRAEIR